MSKKEIVIADVVEKYDNPIAELVQVACQFSSSLYLVGEIIGLMQKALWELWHLTRTMV